MAALSRATLALAGLSYYHARNEGDVVVVKLRVTAKHLRYDEV